MHPTTSKEQRAAAKVKIFKPDAFIVDFHGTICPMKWEEEVVLPYVIENLNAYLIENWAVIDLMNLIDTLRQESFIQRFKFNRNDAPLIEDDSEDLQSVRRSICELRFLLVCHSNILSCLFCLFVVFSIKIRSR